MIALFSLMVADKTSSVSNTHPELNYTTHNTCRGDQHPVLDLTELRRPDNTIGTCLSLIVLSGSNIITTDITTEPLPVDGNPADWLRWITNSTKGRSDTEQ